MPEQLTPTEKMYWDVLLEAGEEDKYVKSSKLINLKPPPPPRVSNLVDVHMMNLRKKLKGSGYKIETIRGVGYKLIQL